MKTKAELSELTERGMIAVAEKTEKGLRAVASTSTLDRQGESIDQTGWDLKNFKKNPILLWSHDHTEPPIGKAKNIRVEGEGKKAALTFEPEFHDVTPRAQAIGKLFDQGIMNSFSVGFMPIEADGNTFTKSELLEISAVGVPANPEARTMAYKSLKKAGFSEETIESIGISIVDKKLSELQDEVADLKSQIGDVVKGMKILNPSGRNEVVVNQRLALSKAIARATDKMLEKKQGNTALLKIVKRSNERLILDHKEELKNG